MASFDVPIEGLHTETGPGVYEAAILYSELLEAGDRAVLFKSSIGKPVSITSRAMLRRPVADAPMSGSQYRRLDAVTCLSPALTTCPALATSGAIAKPRSTE